MSARCTDNTGRRITLSMLAIGMIESREATASAHLSSCVSVNVTEGEPDEQTSA